MQKVAFPTGDPKKAKAVLDCIWSSPECHARVELKGPLDLGARQKVQ